MCSIILSAPTTDKTSLMLLLDFLKLPRFSSIAHSDETKFNSCENCFYSLFFYFKDRVAASKEVIMLNSGRMLCSVRKTMVCKDTSFPHMGCVWVIQPQTAVQPCIPSTAHTHPQGALLPFLQWAVMLTRTNTVSHMSASETVTSLPNERMYHMMSGFHRLEERCGNLGNRLCH